MDYIVIWQGEKMRLRKYLDITKESVELFEERTGIHKVTIYKYLRGGSMPELKKLVELEEYTDGSVMPNDFLEHHKALEKGKKG